MLFNQNTHLKSPKQKAFVLRGWRNPREFWLNRITPSMVVIVILFLDKSTFQHINFMYHVLNNEKRSWYVCRQFLLHFVQYVVYKA